MDAEGFKIPPPPGKILHSHENKLENNSVSEAENRKRGHEEDDNPEPKKKKGNISNKLHFYLSKLTYSSLIMQNVPFFKQYFLL